MNRVMTVSLNKKNVWGEKEIEKTAEKILQILKAKNCYLEIFLISGRKLKFLNKKFRGQDKKANILTFEEPYNFIYPPSKFKKLGEIYLNVQLINKQRIRVWQKLLIHGVLHLFGYRHQKESEGMKMEKREAEIFNKI